jgi:thiol:disulfide interchange protein DsbA
MLAAAAQSTFAQSPPLLGRDYLQIPQALPPGATVQVTEFFWYACPNCYALEPRLARWAAALPPDVTFHRVPAVPNALWGTAARVYFALDALGVEGRLRAALFDAIHRDGLRITDEPAVTEWVGRHGVDPGAYTAAYHSPAVEARLQEAARLTLDYGIRSLGVPSMLVGRYVTNADMTGSPGALLAVSDYLIGLARSELQSR